MSRLTSDLHTALEQSKFGDYESCTSWSPSKGCHCRRPAK